MWFRPHKPYSRTEILEAAGMAQAKGKTKKAIAEYLKVLDANPDDYVVHGKVAPLLARTKQPSRSWSSFMIAGEGYNLGGFDDKALSVYIQACRCVPLEVEAWEKVSRLQLSRGLREEAVNTLLKGQRFFRGRALREKAIRLLRRAWEVVPWHFEVTLELARLLAKNKDKDEALRLLRGLAGREEGRNLRRIRGAIMRISPTPASAWQWLRLRKG